MQAAWSLQIYKLEGLSEAVAHKYCKAALQGSLLMVQWICYHMQTRATVIINDKVFIVVIIMLFSLDNKEEHMISQLQVVIYRCRVKIWLTLTYVLC